MGQAALFTPPTIHKSNVVLFPNYLTRSRLKGFAKTLKGSYTTNSEGLVTIVNDLIEFHYKSYNKHIELVDLTATPAAIPDAVRCLEFLRYESYLLQKPIFCHLQDPSLLPLLREQGFRIIDDEEEQSEVYSNFWDYELQKV
ncbi:hypothetical protein [Ammoniphilus resinae]|uniref:STAS domain-containing protein n=1 Tax=Ammoniphilus resinae TaxID=861532 RepID=A0ABS4GKF9_9BACL|nr:hypothetical protein [Ammoniphilus resinae]MBP1930729.1 hypothetical protein [Ammoniphilus resinae]